MINKIVKLTPRARDELHTLSRDLSNTDNYVLPIAEQTRKISEACITLIETILALDEAT